MTVIFQTCIKCEDKGCKIIIDNESCITAVSSTAVICLGLKLISHSKPYNVSCVNNNSIAVNERCLFPIKFLDYHDEIWCDMILMDVYDISFRGGHEYIIYTSLFMVNQIYVLLLLKVERSNSLDYY